jgi:hypothetical protein
MRNSQFGHGNPTERSLWRLSEILREIASSPKQRESDPAADDQHPGEQIQDFGAKPVGAAMTENPALRCRLSRSQIAADHQSTRKTKDRPLVKRKKAGVHQNPGNYVK